MPTRRIIRVTCRITFPPPAPAPVTTAKSVTSQVTAVGLPKSASSAILIGLLSISEALPFLDGIHSNGLVHSMIDLLSKK